MEFLDSGCIGGDELQKFSVRVAISILLYTANKPKREYA